MPSLPLIISLFIFPILVIAQPPGGLTFESCLSDLGCTAPRSCRDSSTFRLCDTSSRGAACVCVPPTFTPCKESSECTEGEVCARTLDTPFVCTSALVAVPPTGPTTAEEAKQRPFIPNCPRPKRSSGRRSTPIPPDTPPGIPPDIPPDASPDAPFFPPDAGPGSPQQPIPVPGPPGAPPPDVSDPKRNGLNLQICKPGTCARGLSCVSFDDAASFGPPQDGARKGGQSFRCCDDLDPVCICHARDTRASCLSNADCNKREVCAKTPVSPPTCTAVEALEKLTPGQQRRVTIFEGSTPGERGTKVPLVESPTPAEEDDEMTGSPTEEEEEENVIMETPVPVEVSVSPVASVSPSPSADVVVEVTTEATPNVEGQEEEEEDGICIDAEALGHLDRSELVFEHDRHARVVCDVNGSCATGGHMVRYREKVMMMKRYCEMVGCVEKVIKVNSPRYRRGMKVESRTEGLRYTSLAARYGTRVEEHVLVGIIRFGL